MHNKLDHTGSFHVSVNSLLHRRYACKQTTEKAYHNIHKSQTLRLVSFFEFKELERGKIGGSAKQVIVFKLAGIIATQKYKLNEQSTVFKLPDSSCKYHSMRKAQHDVFPQICPLCCVGWWGKHGMVLSLVKVEVLYKDFDFNLKYARQARGNEDAFTVNLTIRMSCVLFCKCI